MSTNKIMDRNGAEIVKGTEVEILDEAKIADYQIPAGIFGNGDRYSVQDIDVDGCVLLMVKHRTWWIPPGSYQVPEDVTEPERTPAMLPPNPKAAFGAQKPDLSLVPPVAMLHAAMAFENGAGKYGPYNWRERAVEARTYVAAAKRHLDAWLDGQECSNDTNPPVHNLGHVIACVAILLDCQEQGNLIDNRPKAGRSAEVQDRMKAQKVEAEVQDRMKAQKVEAAK